MECPKCKKEITEVDYYKYHLRCKDCWNAYCKTKRYYNKDVQKRAYQKFKMDHPRLCKKCGEMKMPTEFQPNKKHCKECFIPADELKKLYATSEIGKQKRKELKVKKQTVIKAKKEKSIVKIPKEIKVKERKRTQTKANQRKPPQKAIIETPDKIIKVKTILYQKVKIDNCRRTNKFVRKGWDEIMNQIRLKIECSTI